MSDSAVLNNNNGGDRFSSMGQGKMRPVRAQAVKPFHRFVAQHKFRASSGERPHGDIGRENSLAEPGSQRFDRGLLYRETGGQKLRPGALQALQDGRLVRVEYSPRETVAEFFPYPRNPGYFHHIKTQA